MLSPSSVQCGNIRLSGPRRASVVPMASGDGSTPTGSHAFRRRVSFWACWPESGHHRTQERRASLRSSEEKFRQLAENIREVFWIMPPAGDEMLYVSPAYEQIWGRRCESLYRNPMSWAEAIHPDDRERAHACLRGKSREKPSSRNTAYERLTGRRNGFATGLFRFATRRGTDSHRRNCGGDHRAETLRAGTDPGSGGCRRRQSGQERISGQHEPRNPHAHERRHRHDRTAAGHRADPGAAAATPKSSQQRRGPAGASSTTSWTSPRSRRAKLTLEVVDFDLHDASAAA